MCSCTLTLPRESEAGQRGEERPKKDMEEHSGERTIEKRDLGLRSWVVASTAAHGRDQ